MDYVARGKNEKCLICLKKFTLFNPYHICKRCLRSVCKDCANTKAGIFEKGGEKKMHRLCSRCMPENEFLTNYKTTYKLVFNSNSKIGSSWADELAKKFPKTGYYERFKRQPLKNKQELWESFNFSMRNFIGLMTEGIDFYPTLKNVYDKLHIQSSDFVCLFFLSHCAEQKAIDAIYGMYHMLQEFPVDVTNVHANLQYLGCTSRYLPLLKSYVDQNFQSFIHSLSLNFVTAELSLFIISAMIKERHPRAIEKGMAAAIVCVKDFIIKYYDYNKKAVYNELVLNVRFNQFYNNMKILSQKDKIYKYAITALRNSTTSRQSIKEELYDIVVIEKEPPKPMRKQTANQYYYVVPTQRTQSLAVNPLSSSLNFQKKEESKDISRPDQGSDVDNMYASTGSFQQRKMSFDYNDFDYDLKRIYQHNYKMLVQAKALKKLSYKLLQQIDEL